MADQPKKKNPNSVSRNDARPSGKRPKSKTDDHFGHGASYRGSHTRKSPQTMLQKVLLGHGALEGIGRRSDGTNPRPWSLSNKPSDPPFDAAQVAENRRLYPHLFADE